ncbi:hypothetical protein GGTG_13255 [Gaeumannomyces tritici R3-111a-1]|uniref:BAH domain-containing protein n=1 Tax=Gaeumannomyces tritici (strain R3-111a-1) TaxID=644352 RepID=J3PIC7_GAET3|nr:hypothetical protein GGTG_13255 [Gaeumannomyces tritici R3-111a-1]EJT69146.1 hypothetical protein GGTG_13255 [Gaeumannomyces tritici R3-111a-1]
MDICESINRYGYTYTPASFALVQNKDPVNWVAQIVEIRKWGDQVYLLIYWMYRYEDLPNEHRGFYPMPGELVATNHMDVILAESLVSVAKVFMKWRAPRLTQLATPPKRKHKEFNPKPQQTIKPETNEDTSLYWIRTYNVFTKKLSAGLRPRLLPSLKYSIETNQWSAGPGNRGVLPNDRPKAMEARDGKVYLGSDLRLATAPKEVGWESIRFSSLRCLGPPALAPPPALLTGLNRAMNVINGSQTTTTGFSGGRVWVRKRGWGRGDPTINAAVSPGCSVYGDGATCNKPGLANNSNLKRGLFYRACETGLASHGGFHLWKVNAGNTAWNVDCVTL